MLFERAGEQLVQPRVERIVAGEHLRRRSAANARGNRRRTRPPRARSGSRRRCPRLSSLSQKPSNRPGGDPGEIERGRAIAANARHLRADRGEDLGPFGEIAMPLIRDAGGDQRLGQPARAETRSRPSCSQAPRLFSAQKVSSVIGW